MVFPTLKMFKEVVKDYNVFLGRVVKFKKNDKRRCRASCYEGSHPWEIFCSLTKQLGCFQIKGFNPNHTSCRVLKNPLVDRKWVSKKLVDALRINPAMIAGDAYKYG